MRTAVLALAATALALAVLGVLHHELLLLPALAVGAAAAVMAALVRGPWAGLPGYVGLWLDLGVIVTAALLGAASHALSFGLAFAVLRGPELLLFFGAGLLSGLATTGLAYTHLRLAAEIEASALRLAELERAALQSRLSVLSAQVNPHFLFNTLNTLAELVHEDEDAAEEMVTDLSAMMRSALRSSTKQVPLSEELALIGRLLRIESARLGDRLQWTVDIEPTLPEVAVPGLLIQPLVENAVKHGVFPRPEGGRVSVSARRVRDHIEVRVEDDGPGLPEDVAQELAAGALSMRGTEGSGGGLRSCAERLRLTWPGGRAKLHCDASGGGTTLILELPIDGERR